MKKYSPLILVFALLLTGCVTKLKDKSFSWVDHSCTFTGDYDAPGFLDMASYPPEYNGTFRCTNPDGSNFTCPGTNQPAGRVEFTARVTYPRDITEANFWSNMGCGSASKATPTPTPTAVPTATATEIAPAPAASAPLLTGEVTACSVRDGFINFKLVKDAPAISGNDVLVMMNGTQVTCTVVGTKKDLLSCALPVGVTFPAKITVALGDAMTNQFTYDGAGCSNVPPKNGGGSDGGTSPSAPSGGGGDIPPP